MKFNNIVYRKKIIENFVSLFILHTFAELTRITLTKTI